MRTLLSRSFKIALSTAILGASLLFPKFQADPAHAAVASGEHWKGLATVVQPIIDAGAEHGVGLSVGVQDLSGTYDHGKLELGSEEAYYSASIIKLAIVSALMREVEAGKLSLEQKLTVEPSSVVGGAGSLQKESFPQDIAVERLAKLMITQSDNTATNVLITLLGFDKINAFIDSQGFEVMHLGRKMMTPAKSPAEDNYVNSSEMLSLLTRIYKAEVVSAQSRDIILGWMKAQEVKTKFGAALPGKPIAHKTGELGDVSHDVGYFLIPGKEVAVTVLSKVLKTEDAGNAQTLDNPYIQRIAKAVYNYVSDHPSASSYPASAWPAMALAVGPIVEAAESQGIRVSVGLKDLAGQAEGAEVLIGSRQPYMPASTIKLALVAALMKQVDAGVLTLDQKVTVDPTDVVGGTGSLQKEQFPQDVTLERLARLMITQSDNTATNVLIDAVGLETVQKLMDELDLKTMHLGRKMFASAPTPAQDNYIDAVDLIKLLGKIYNNEFLSAESGNQIIEWMKAQEVDSKFGAALQGAPIAHKTGENANVTHDTGFILVSGKEIAISVLTDVTTTGSFDEAQEIGNPIVQSVAKAVYQTLSYESSYTDLPDGYWAKPFIDAVSAAGVASGTSATTFSPERDVTRAEFVALLVRSLGLKASEGEATFSDVSEDAWYASAVKAAFDAGIVSGKGEGHFDPSAPITREEVVSLIVKSYEMRRGVLADSDSASGYKDANNISEWAKPAVSKATTLELIAGYADGTFRPNDTATRAEAAKLIVALGVK